jgi:FkbM family methyltransferase
VNQKYNLKRLFIGIRRNIIYSNGLQICFERILRPEAKIAHYIWKGRFYFVVDPSVKDQMSLHEIFNFRVYDSYLAACSFPEQQISYVNVGANVGAFDVRLLEFGLEIRNSLAVELNPHTFDRCKVNFHANAVPTTLINAGVAGAEGMVDFLPSRSSLGDSIFASKGPKDDRTVPVQLLTLETLLNTYASHNSQYDLLKLDCEGAEYPILRQTSVAMFRRFRYIIIEFHREPHGETLAAAISKLRDAGFAACDREPRQLPFVGLFIRADGQSSQSFGIQPG